MDREEELLTEIAVLRAENIRLRGRIARDRRFADERLKLAIKLDTNADKRRLRRQINELQRTVKAEHALIDQVVVYLRKRNDPREDEP